MTPETQLALIQAIAALPASALLVLAIVGILRGDVVTRQHYEAMKNEKEEHIAWLERQVDRLANGQQTRFHLDKS